MANLPHLPNEEQEIQAQLDKVASHPKLGRWIKLFLDKTNATTYGNKTQSALAAYNLDPATQYFSAAQIGYENMKKLKTLASAYYDADGMTASKVLDLIAGHAIGGKPKALEMLAAITGVYEAKTNVSIQNNQTVINNAQASKDDAKAFSDKFEQFIDAEYSTPSSQSDLPETVG